MFKFSLKYKWVLKSFLHWMHEKSCHTVFRKDKAKQLLQLLFRVLLANLYLANLTFQNGLTLFQEYHAISTEL